MTSTLALSAVATILAASNFLSDDEHPWLTDATEVDATFAPANKVPGRPYAVITDRDNIRADVASLIDARFPEIDSVRQAVSSRSSAAWRPGPDPRPHPQALAQRPREWPTRRRLEFLESAGILTREGQAFEIAGVKHTPYQIRKNGLPILNRRGRIHEKGADHWGIAGGVSFPPIVSDEFAFGRDRAVAIAKKAAGVHALRASPRIQVGWFAMAGGTVPAWQVVIPSRLPLGTFQVTIDASTGEVLTAVDLLKKKKEPEPPFDPSAGTGYVFDPNIVESPSLTPVPIPALDESGFLSGDVTHVIDERAVEAYEPGRIFAYPPDDPRVVQTAVYRNLTDTGLFAVRSGFPPFLKSIPAFTNIADPESGGEFNNAFYDPVIPAFAFGNGDGAILANLGTDRDVAAHEMGHHLFETLVTPTINFYDDPVLAMHEGVADTFSALLGGDAEVGESTVPGAPYLRTLENDARYPEDWHPDPHVTGLIYGGSNWDISRDKKADSGQFARILLSSLPFLPPDAIETEYRDAILLGDAVNGGKLAMTIRNVFKDRGFDEMELPPEFQGYVTNGITENGFLPDSTNKFINFHYYFFSEFPGSSEIRFHTSGGGDVDLLVAPWATFDPDDPNTYKFSGGTTSSETVVVSASTTPSVHADDFWIVWIFDYHDFRSSSYSLTVDATLPSNGVAVDGSTVAGSIGEVGEIDFFTFAGSAGQVVRVEVQDLGGTLDPLVAVFTPDEVEVLASDDDSGPGGDSLIQGVALPYSGQYGVAVLSLVADVDPRTGTGAYGLTLSSCENSGTDSDLDGLVDACDDDDDNDGYKDANDADALDPTSCVDLDQDGCNDCSSGSSDWLNDGPDADGDGVCDLGDSDDDNDGCEDSIDVAPLTPSTDPDLDFLGADCDNCPEVPNEGQEDTNSDGLGDACTSCSRIAWTEPALDPPDQNSAWSAIALNDLEFPAGALFTATGSFNPAGPSPIDPSAIGVYLRLADWDGLLLDINVPPGAPGSGCGPNDGWTGVSGKKSGFTWTYINESNALPAAGCAAESGRGLTSISISDLGTSLGYDVAAVGIPLVRPLATPVRFLQLDLVLGTGLANGFPSPAGDSGMCAESILWSGTPSSSCVVSQIGEILTSVECGVGSKGKKKKSKKKK